MSHMIQIQVTWHRTGAGNYHKLVDLPPGGFETRIFCRLGWLSSIWEPEIRITAGYRQQQWMDGCFQNSRVKGLWKYFNTIYLHKNLYKCTCKREANQLQFVYCDLWRTILKETDIVISTEARLKI